MRPGRGRNRDLREDSPDARLARRPDAAVRRGRCRWRLRRRRGSELPDIGTPANTTLSLEDEYKIGLMIVRSMRDAGQIVDDPEINEYLQSLGMRLVEPGA